MAAAAQLMSDIEAIKQLKARYFRLLDQKRWDEWRGVFVADVEIRTPDDTGDPAPIVGRDAFVDGLRAMIDSAPTVHHGHMPEMAVDGATASGVWAMEG